MDEAKLVLFEVDGEFVAVRARDAAHAGFIQEAHAEDARYLGIASVMRHNQFRQVITQRRLALALAGLTEPPSRKRTGIVARWQQDESYGFITDDTGQNWYVARHGSGAPEPGITQGAPVSFTGSPHTQADQRYPRAYSVTPVRHQPEA